MSEAKRMSEKRLDNIKMWADAGMPVGSVGVIELFQHIAAVESELAAAKQRNADYRDCLEVAGKIAEAVECYDSDDLLEPIVQYLIPVFGEIERLHAELAAAKAECDRLRKLAKQFAEANTKLRRIACHVPGRAWMKASEECGYGSTVSINDHKIDEAWLEFTSVKPKEPTP